MSSFIEYVGDNQAEILSQLMRHLYLVGVAMAVAIAVGVPVGVAVSERPRARKIALAAASVMQTVPSLALFGFLIPLPIIGGTDARPAIIALMLYALLPIIKNTVTGLNSVAPAIAESATAMGMTSKQLLFRVRLPLAMPMVLAGVRIAAVISVGTATIAAAAGAEGLGVFIFRGLETYNTDAMLAGAVPAAILALVLDALLGIVERRLSTTTE